MDRETLPTLLDQSAKAVSVIAALSLLSSITYDWAYFYALGLSFADLPTSLADHVRSSLIWVPKVALGFLATMAFELLTQRIEGGLTEDEIIQSSPNPQRTRRFRDGPFIMGKITAIIGVISFLLFGELFISILFLSLVILWFAFSAWVNSHPRIQARRSRLALFLIHWVPAALIWLVFMGFSSAEAEVKANRNDPGAHVIYVGDNRGEPITGTILRTFDKGLLIVRPGEMNTSFLGWDEILRIENRRERRAFRGAFCEWFRILCRPYTGGSPVQESTAPRPGSRP